MHFRFWIFDWRFEGWGRGETRIGTNWHELFRTGIFSDKDVSFMVWFPLMVSCGVGIAYFREFEVQLAATWCNLVQPTASSCNSARRARTQPVDKCGRSEKFPGTFFDSFCAKKPFWSDLIRISRIYSEMVRIGQTGVLMEW